MLVLNFARFGRLVIPLRQECLSGYLFRNLGAADLANFLVSLLIAKSFLLMPVAQFGHATHQGFCSRLLLLILTAFIVRRLTVRNNLLVVVITWRFLHKIRILLSG